VQHCRPLFDTCLVYVVRCGVTRETSFCGVTALVSSIYGGHAPMHEVSSVISPSQALVLSSSHRALSRACVRGWIVVGPEGDILQCDMFAKRVEGRRGRLARQRQYCYSRRALVVGAAPMDGWEGVVFGRVLACLEDSCHDSPNE
jgi:hypothetical protein